MTTKQNAQDVGLLLMSARNDLNNAIGHLNHAIKFASMDYPGNETRCIELKGAAKILMSSLVNELDAWHGYAKAREG